MRVGDDFIDNKYKNIESNFNTDAIKSSEIILDDSSDGLDNSDDESEEDSPNFETDTENDKSISEKNEIGRAHV